MTPVCAHQRAQAREHGGRGLARIGLRGFDARKHRPAPSGGSAAKLHDVGEFVSDAKASRLGGAFVSAWGEIDFVAIRGSQRSRFHRRFHGRLGPQADIGKRAPRKADSTSGAAAAEHQPVRRRTLCGRRKQGTHPHWDKSSAARGRPCRTPSPAIRLADGGPLRTRWISCWRGQAYPLLLRPIRDQIAGRPLIHPATALPASASRAASGWARPNRTAERPPSLAPKAGYRAGWPRR